MHKKIFIIALALLLLLPLSSAEISSSDKEEIQNQIKLIVDSINKGNANFISSMISPNARQGLNEEIESKVAGKPITFSQNIRSFEYIEDNQVKVRGRFSASGIGWEITGFSNYYTFENVEGTWLLTDTNFHTRADGSYILRFIIRIFTFLIPVFLLFSAFWIWMIIDCAQRSFDDKIAWILIIVFLGILGAALYFFIKRKQLRKNKIN